MPNETWHLPAPRTPKSKRNPAIILVSGFAVMILIGTVLLSLPFATDTGQSANPLIALFTATSAVCVTGLVVVDTATYWSTFGQITILLLIQAGGLGFMTSSTLLVLALGRRTTLRSRLALGQALGTGDHGDLVPLVRNITIFTLAVEVIGAVFLALGFVSHGYPLSRSVWFGTFHAISAFNNAGFDLMGDFQSLIPFRQSTWLLSVIGTLVLVGSASYLVVADIFRRRRWRRLRVDTKLVVVTNLVLLLGGAGVILALEFNNPTTLGGLPWTARVYDAAFMSVVPRTAGFTAVDVAALRDPTTFLLMPLMFIGGSAGSTAGGIKVQTFSVLFFAILAALQSREHAVAFGREISHIQVYRALTIALVSVAIVVGVALSLTIVEPERFIAILFETVSAFGTVGMSTGITPDLTTPSRLIIIGVMFVGRLGPLTLALALAARGRPERLRYANTEVRIG